jgi:tRNA pseudouridine55 synthase
LDCEGDIESVPIPETCTKEAVAECLQSFLGESEQLPPMFSAVKVNGKKLYQYAREGKTVERKLRSIVIFTIKLIEFHSPKIRFEVKCSKGTYIRTLVDDIAKKLGTRAYLKGLTRLASGNFFEKNNALALDSAKKMDKSDLQRKFIDPKYILSDWHDVEVDSAILLKHISQGRTIPVPLDKRRFSGLEKPFSKAIATTQSGELVATGNLEFSQDAGCQFSPEKVFI